MHNCAWPVVLAALASCSVSARLLQPRPEWLAEPSALGLEFEDVVLPAGGGATVHGWFVPARNGDGRTVLFCHGNAANITFLHPYYRFLHAAGWNVFVFDYRGFGQSQGQVDVGALAVDTELALDHVLARPDVDRQRIAVFGVSLGAIVALRTVAARSEPCAFVVEDLASPHEVLADEFGEVPAWLLGWLALPDGLEPVANARRVTRPGLFLVGETDDALRQHLAAVAAAGGPVTSWIMAGAGHAPSGMLAHDGVYEQTIVRFLDEALAHRQPRVEAVLGERRGDQWEVQLRRVDCGPEALAVELCLVPLEGPLQFERRWLRTDTDTWTIPGHRHLLQVNAFVHPRGLPMAGEQWQPVAGPLAMAATRMDLWRDLAASAATAPDPMPYARSFLDAWQEIEREHGVFPALAAAELVPASLQVAQALVRAAGPERTAMARGFLERCVAAEPAVHSLHYWPAERHVAGFQHGEAVAAARRLLAELPAP